jgi:hypothetical protein
MGRPRRRWAIRIQTEPGGSFHSSSLRPANLSKQKVTNVMAAGMTRAADGLARSASGITGGQFWTPPLISSPVFPWNPYPGRKSRLILLSIRFVAAVPDPDVRCSPMWNAMRESERFPGTPIVPRHSANPDMSPPILRETCPSHNVDNNNNKQATAAPS